MAAAITVRSGSGGNPVEAKTAVHIEITGCEANVGVVTPKTITGITEADPSQITSAAHGLESGDTIEISGSDTTPSIDGEHVVTVIDANTFSIPVNVTSDGTDIGEWTFVFDDDEQVAGTERRYYILVDSPSGVDDARSQVFQPSSDGKFTWDDYIFPADGAYTLKLRDMLDDSDVATQAVTVAAA